MNKNLKVSIILGVFLMLAGCETAPEVPLTALESCLKDVRSERVSCTLNQIASNGLAGGGNGVCDDRKRMQEDRCYARFK